MPTYSYICQDCDHKYDAFQSMKDEPHTECPTCQGRVQRLIGSGAGILFKGSGFYVNDYSASRSPSSSTGGNEKSTGDKTTTPASEKTTKTSS